MMFFYLFFFSLSPVSTCLRQRFEVFSFVSSVAPRFVSVFLGHRDLSGH